MTSSIDVLIVFHNSSRFVEPLLDSLRRVTVPIRAYFLDNGSIDDTAAKLASAIVDLPFRTQVLRSRSNNGFARGMNLLAGLGSGEFLMLLNPDCELEPGCLEKLLVRAQSDDRAAVCEARQIPREHPKAYDAVTGETTWCSGAAALIRREAFERVGGFDERLFFMYCEDVDLSWKFWLTGWKCIYVSDAVVRHYTQDLLPNKRRTLENYFTFRNSLFLFYRFGNWNRRRVLWKFLRQRFVSSRYSVRSRILFVFAFADHIRYIPYLLHTRHTWGNCSHHWVRFEETSLAG